ncbi:hypothetical protein CR157_00305 [Halomonas sp. LBP4]|nr:hypothetical protein CR157_00305 [Halomonas sp. LBP4]
MSETMRAGLQEATRLTRAGQLQEATAMIQRTLRSGPNQDAATTPTSAPGATIEGSCRVIDDELASAATSAPDESPWRVDAETSHGDAWACPEDLQFDHAHASAAQRPFAADRLAADLHDVWREKWYRFRGPESWLPPLSDRVPDSVPDAGTFTTGAFTNHAGTRDYKLYIPSGHHGQSLPLVVMLHGCTQDPDDFAAGTGMNTLAEEQPCFVLYPAQSAAANSSRCWNWFMETDQQRDRGEPSIIADLTRQVLDEHRLDERRVYVAGLSAGGAMAMTLAMTYPDLYAAVGVHSGLPHAVAQDLPSAFTAMHRGEGASAGRPSGAPGTHSYAAPVPAIVFHGDRDTTVHPCNGDQVIAQCAPSHAKRGELPEGGPAPRLSVERGQVPHGHAYTRTTYHDANGQPIMEQWLVHGAGHAWSGGCSRGSYTDPRGPDATQQMLRFFYAHPQGEASVRHS